MGFLVWSSIIVTTLGMENKLDIKLNDIVTFECGDNIQGTGVVTNIKLTKWVFVYTVRGFCPVFENENKEYELTGDQIKTVENNDEETEVNSSGKKLRPSQKRGVWKEDPNLRHHAYSKIKKEDPHQKHLRITRLFMQEMDKDIQNTNVPFNFFSIQMKPSSFENQSYFQDDQMTKK